MVFLGNFFKSNSYPAHIFSNLLRKFLNQRFQPPTLVLTVPKKILYESFPYIGIYTKLLKKELMLSMSHLYPMAEIRFCFTNPLTIQSLFKFKDKLPEFMRSGVVYEYSCPKCNLGTYIGSTERLLHVRYSSHKGVSHRTGCGLNVKEASAIRDHSNICNKSLNIKDFTILASTGNSTDLRILESLFIKSHNPKLNSDSSSIPLSIA